MAAITHAPIPSITLPIAADYTALPPHLRNQFSDLLEEADAAQTGDAYHQAMIRACLTIGIAVPDGQDIAICDCLNDGCGCGAIFDSHLDGVVITANADPGYNLSALQCPDCGHDHPRPVED
ncbi:hypothetical protein [Streptomyces cylindrosporus]|uniref:Uncharacterized protein n=1 Tax=Streptomyces cylindrosporus TaxID=2927583 RepID=A0ABS9YPH1_9ACTN|nr:hypothetical protein [Streptomyces cylindrosporus]MCI3279172.1 hypothetical protein [Streptomyces cylindrosporus]